MTKVICYIFNYQLYIVNIACKKRRQPRAEKVLGNSRLWSPVTNFTGFSPFVPLATQTLFDWSIAYCAVYTRRICDPEAALKFCSRFASRWNSWMMMMMTTDIAQGWTGCTCAPRVDKNWGRNLQGKFVIAPQAGGRNQIFEDSFAGRGNLEGGIGY